MISSTTCWAGDASAPVPSGLPPRSFTTTLAPSAANRSACSRPMPRPAPVMTATRPSNSLLIVCTSGSLCTDAQLTEGEVAVDIRFSGQAKHALADDVALDLAGTAGDAEHRREEQRGSRRPGRRIVGVPRLSGRTGDRHPELRAALPEQRGRDLRH